MKNIFIASLIFWGAASAANAQCDNGYTAVPVCQEISVPVITSPATATGMVGAAFNYQITATNNPTTYGMENDQGLAFDANTGIISGIPITVNIYTVILSATNAAGTGSENLTITIYPAAAPVITSALTAIGKVGTPFGYIITATNSPTSFSANPLPPGLSVNATNGLVSGVPTVANMTSMAITAFNSSGGDEAAVIVTINP